MQELLEAGKSTSTLKGMVAAIKAARVGDNKLAESDCSLISRFLKGAVRLAPGSRRPVVPAWDLKLVLAALQLEPFEPLASVDLKWLSLKVAFLIAVASARRVGEIQALSIHESCCRFLPESAGVLLRPNPAFLPKVLSDFHLHQPVVMKSLSLAQEGDGEAHDWALLCPVRALKIYIQRTGAFRKTDQLFVCFHPRCLGQPVSKSRLSHWIVDTIRQAYAGSDAPAPRRVRAHSTRGIATSWALWRGASLSEVCAAATWSSPSTFARFYNLNVAAGNAFGEQVLGVGMH